MEQREVTTPDNTKWVCVQALSGSINPEHTEKAAELAENEAGNVPVVCTPTGGAQSVRLQLPANWFKSVPDKELIKKIGEAQ
jgi:hypothetical protein